MRHEIGGPSRLTERPAPRAIARQGMVRTAWLVTAGVVAAGLLQAGCAGGAAKDMAAAPVPADRHAQDSPILPVLDLMRELGQGDPARQAELFEGAKDAAELAPTTANRLKFALALSVPGHSGSDEVAAQRQLSELLARPETLVPSERMLALVQLKDVEQRLMLQTDLKRVRDDANRDTRDADRLTAANRKLTAEMDENARLRKALDDARAKLDAVTHIERSINDRGSATTPAATGSTPAPP